MFYLLLLENTWCQMWLKVTFTLTKVTVITDSMFTLTLHHRVTPGLSVPVCSGRSRCVPDGPGDVPAPVWSCEAEQEEALQEVWRVCVSECRQQTWSVCWCRCRCCSGSSGLRLTGSTLGSRTRTVRMEWTRRCWRTCPRWSTGWTDASCPSPSTPVWLQRRSSCTCWGESSPTRTFQRSSSVCGTRRFRLSESCLTQSFSLNPAAGSDCSAADRLQEK